jgi:hypothetical protein
MRRKLCQAGRNIEKREVILFEVMAEVERLGGSGRFCKLSVKNYLQRYGAVEKCGLFLLQ